MSRQKGTRPLWSTSSMKMQHPQILHCYIYPKFATENNTYVYYAVSSSSTTENPERGGERSFVGIVATEADCVVEFTPTATASAFIARGQHLVHSPGVLVRSPPLPKDTVIFLHSEDDLTGTKVTGTCYLSVISGHQCAFYPANVQSCDGIMEQIPPTETWGFNFFLSPLAKRQSAGYRFIARADNTVVTHRCKCSEPDTFTLTSAGSFREVLVNNPFCLKVYPIAATKYQVVFIISTDLDNDYANYMQLLLRNSRIWEYNACVSCGVFSLPTVYELIEYLHCASCVFVHAIMCFFTW